MRPITSAQLKIIHMLLGQLDLMARKPEIVYSFTDGRTESSREMTLIEAKSLIEYLKGSQEKTTIIRRIWHLAYESGIIVPGDHDERSMNAAKLDSFCKQYGTVKKAISMQSLKELKRTVKQFEAMYHKRKDKQETLDQIEALKGYINIFIKHEDYERAAEAKKFLDKLTEEIAPKRKKAAKAV
ncbi:hypothetical protein [Parabacteroides sp. Marseille-P3160]|uniref:hypothetical protein n=1 Tax=Parabacteroides sp. Marseille-P3160 TaxID=1917887 RepID=UPI0009BA4158|nr:hypothetical protein [Parabacteroides sp. Marseille-P3160]